MTEPPQANSPHDEAWVAEVMAPGPNGTRYDAQAAAPASAALPSATVFMDDGVNVAALPAGAQAYAGYYNGTYANLAELQARFPSAIIVSITPNGANGAMYIDIEPGNAAAADAPGFIKSGGTGYYCSASAAASCISACTDAGPPGLSGAQPGRYRSRGRHPAGSAHRVVGASGRRQRRDIRPAD